MEFADVTLESSAENGHRFADVPLEDSSRRDSMLNVTLGSTVNSDVLEITPVALEDSIDLTPLDQSTLLFSPGEVELSNDKYFHLCTSSHAATSTPVKGTQGY